MRITNNMMTNTLLHNLKTNLNNMARLQEMNADGNRIHRPSDDPVGISSILKLKTDLGELDQYKQNIESALSWYEVTESAIITLSSAVERIWELAVQAANTATNTPDDLAKIKAEIKELRDHVVSSGNFSYAGKYVFSGHQNDKPLFKTDKLTGLTTYNIDVTDKDVARPERQTYLVSQSEQIQVTSNGLDVFGVNKSNNVYGSLLTDSSGSNFSEGLSVIQTRFNPAINYTGDNLNITVGGVEYNVDETGMDGTTNPVDKTMFLERLRNAFETPAPPLPATPRKLSDVANVYYDEHDNLVIAGKNSGEPVTSASAEMKFSESVMGITAKKSELKGKFALEGPDSDYRAKNLNVTIGGKTYNVDESELTGHGFELGKEKVLEKFRNASETPPPSPPAVPGKLSDVADVFFDHENNLVIKHKAYGNLPIAMAGTAAPGFVPSLHSGTASTEASVKFEDFPLDPAFFADAANQNRLKANTLYITHNGERKAVPIDPNAIIDTPEKYRDALQDSINKHIGAGKVTVSTAGGYLSFTTQATPDGIKPEIFVEPVVSNESSLINDLDRFIKALDTSNQGDINWFLGSIDEHKDRILAVRADLGAKSSRMELALERTKDNKLSFTSALTDVQNVDLAESIMLFKNLENVYNASLSVGGKIIQPSLVDFIR